MRAMFYCLLCALAFAITAGAQKPFSIDSLEEKTSTDATETYADLIIKTFPGARYDPDYATVFVDESFELRQLFGDREKSAYEAPLQARVSEGWRFTANGAPHLALLIVLADRMEDPSAALYEQPVLAVYRSEEVDEKTGDGSKTRSKKVFRLVEAVDPQTDRFVEFPSDFPLIDESQKNQFFWVINLHWNSSEGFVAYETVRVAGARRVEPAIEKMVGVYQGDDCSENSLDFFSVRKTERAAKGALPYDFRLRTRVWTPRECRRAGTWTTATEEFRLYRARRVVSAKNKRTVWRLVLVGLKRKKIRSRHSREYQ